jgi:anti-sigma regulatory factor (Ser/Thr protein kinase)
LTLQASATFEAKPTEAAAARRFVRAVMQTWGVAAEDVVLLANELATNAVLHARGPFDIQLNRTANRVRVAVRDDNTRLPEWGTVPVDALSGRGLGLVLAMAADWGIDSQSGLGKTVWFEVELCG